MTDQSTAPIVFMDTETTGLALTDDIWEFAAIRREGDGSPDYPLHLFVEHDPEKAAALPESFRLDLQARFDPDAAVSPRDAARLINAITRPSANGAKAHIVGAVPNFDTERLALLLNAHGITPRWHYHLTDVETLAVGQCAGMSGTMLLPPWDSDAVSEQIGVQPPTDRRHTAMGDAEWARAIFDHVSAARRPPTARALDATQAGGES